MAEDCEQYKNSFCGQIDGIPNINVDNFIDKNKMAYFLSHVHSDHIGGLIGEDQSALLAKSLENNGGKIYMTEESKIIFENKYVNAYETVKDYLVVLVTGKQHDLVDLQLTVTLIPVVHMPGAVMFLFKTPEGKTILYTGDFIFDSEDLENFEALHDTNNKPIAIDLIYYDATFDNDAYRHKCLPDTAKCVKTATELIEKWLLEEQGNAVAIRIKYNYGFEGLFYGIVKGLQTKSKETKKLGDIKISMKNHDVFNVYGKILKDVENVYTMEASRIHICKNYKSNSHKFCFTNPEAYKKYSKYLNIAVSTLNWKAPSDKSPLKMKGTTETFFDLCYPTHCSQEKLDEFIKYFNPKDCKPFALQSCSSTTRRDRELVPGEPNEGQGIPDEREQAITKALEQLSLSKSPK